MKSKLLVGILAVCAAQVWGADSAAKEQVMAAAKKLAEQSYSWKTTVTAPEGARFRSGPTEGKTEKGGFTHVKSTMGDNTYEMALKGEKTAISTDEGWQLTSELESAQGAGRGRAFMARNFRAPADQAIDALAFVKEFKKEGDVYAGTLSEEGVKSLISWRRRANTEGPQVSDPQGTARFWVKDGVLAKYEIHVKGRMTFNNNDMDIDRTTVVEIKDAGKTKVELPDAAKKKLS